MGCRDCEGQPLILTKDLAEALSSAFGRRRNFNRVHQYGGKGIIQFDAPSDQTIIQQSLTLVNWESEDKMPHPMTVEWGRIVNGGGGSFPAGTDADGNTLYYRAYALIYISSPATTEDYFFADVGRGQKFVVSASRVSVTLAMYPPPDTGVTGLLSGSMPVYATLGYGTSPTLAPVLYTQYIEQLATSFGSNTAELVIPPRANFLLPVRSTDPTGSVTQIDFVDNGGATVDSFQFAGATMVTPAEIPADAYIVRVTNQGAITVDYRLVYQLSV